MPAAGFLICVLTYICPTTRRIRGATKIDVEAQVGAVTRELRPEGEDAERLHVQSLAQEYPSAIEDVWDAVTNAERIPRWFLPISRDLELGGRYQLVGNAGGEVLACDPPRGGAASYRVTWEFGGGVSGVTVRLTDVGPDLTRLELEHEARAADLPADMWEKFGAGATGVGWDGGLLGLALHLGTQQAALAPSEAEAWSTTDNGKVFYRAAADAWATAQVAAGEDSAAAARAADSTYDFYTGG